MYSHHNLETPISLEILVIAKSFKSLHLHYFECKKITKID